MPLGLPAWDRARHLRQLAGAPPILPSWEEVLFGSLGAPVAAGGDTTTDGEDWDTGTPCQVNSETPWNMLRYALIWSIWCQHCDFDLRTGTFHLGIALYRAWKITVQIGMGT